MGSLVRAFAGLLDRSVQEIAGMVADARNFDGQRVGRIADIWDNNTLPLVSVACAPRAVRERLARDGLLWMADLGAARRALMVELDPALDSVLPPAPPEPLATRDFHVRSGALPVTTETLAGVGADYDLAGAGVRSITARPARAGLDVQLTLAAPRRFTPSDGGAREPAPVYLSFVGVTSLRFDAADRVGVSVTCTDAGLVGAIGRAGNLRAAGASIRPDDPRWYESSAGRAADRVTPRTEPERRKPVSTVVMSSRQRAAAEALTDLMLEIRLAGYYPELASSVPVRELCRCAAGAGSAALAAGDSWRPTRGRAFAKLGRRWSRGLPELAPVPVPAGPAVLRYARYEEPYDNHEGSVILVAAVPDGDATAPWRLASERLAGPTRFSITNAAFDGAHDVRRDAGSLTMVDALAVRTA